MGSGASKRGWQQRFHFTINATDGVSEVFTQVFPVWTIAVTRNMKQMAMATGNHRINLWCLVNHILLISLSGHADTIWHLEYSPDDNLLASSSADGTVRLWEVATGILVMILPRSHANWVWSLAWSPDGSRLVTGGSDTRIMVWNALDAAIQASRAEDLKRAALQTGDPQWEEAWVKEQELAALSAQPLLAWQAHEKSIHGVAFAKQDARQLVSVGAEGTVAVWASNTGALDCRLMGHIGKVNCLDTSPVSDNLLATGGEDHTVRLWDLHDIEPGTAAAKLSCEKATGYNLQHFTLKGHLDAVTSVAFCRDGRLLASASKDCEIRIWNPSATSPTLNTKFAAHEAWATCVRWTVDQRFLFTSSTDGLVFAWDVPSKYRYKDKKPH